MSGTRDMIVRNGVLTRYIGLGGNIIIPEGAHRIDKYVFRDNLRIVSAVIPAEVKTVDMQAFKGCQHMRRLTLQEGLRDIEVCAFDGCSALEEVDLPDTVTYMGRAAFAGCTKLKRVRLPEKLPRIGNMAFWNCVSLKEVTIPESVTQIGQSAFYCCDELESVTFPSNLQKIGANAFGFCVRLTSVVLPESVKEIEELAFAGCRRLTTVVIPGVLEGFRADSVFDSHRPWLGIIAPRMRFEEMSCKRNFAVGYARARRLGIEYDAEQTQRYLDYIRRQRKALYAYALEDADLLQLMMEEKLIPVEEVDKVLAMCKDSVEHTAVLMHYKNSLMTPELAEKLRRREERQAERIFSDAPMTVKEAKETWRFETKDGQITITSYKGNDREVTVPDRIGKGVVTAIGAQAFSPIQKRIVNEKARYEMKSIYLPATVTKIGDSAFLFCGVEDLHMTENVTEIGSMGIDTDGTTIYAPTGSYAESYATVYRIPFVAE